MSSEETRKRLIHAIAERQFSGNNKKLMISDIANDVGISRQAFNRYYGDLKPYISGEKLIAELLSNDDSPANGQYLVRNQETINALEAEIANKDALHKKELNRITDIYITTLMNNDITLWKVDETRATIEKQTDLIKSYAQQITELKLKLTSIEIERFKKIAPNPSNTSIVLQPGLAAAFNDYQSNKDEERLENAKDQELQKLANKASQYNDDSQYEIIVFLDLYICSFEKFIENHSRPLDKTYVYIRLPLFSTMEIKIFMRSLSMSKGAKLYVPQCRTENEKLAQRKFHHRSIPSIELSTADNAPHMKIELGFSEVTYYLVAQGD